MFSVLLFQLDVATLLYDKGLLMTEQPLQTMYDEGSDSDKDESDQH